MAIKVADLAKELGVSSESVLEQLRKLYVDVEDENSGVDEKIAGLVRLKLGGSGVAGIPAQGKKKAKAAASAKSRTSKATKKEESSAVRKQVRKKAQAPESSSGTESAAKLRAGRRTEGAELKKKEKAEATEAKSGLITSSASEAVVRQKGEPVSRREAKPEAEEPARPAGAGPVKKAPEDTKTVSAKKTDRLAKTRPVIEIVEKAVRPRPEPEGGRKGVKQRPRATADAVKEDVKPGSKFKKFGKDAKFKPSDKKATTAEPVQPPVRKTPQKIQIQVPVSIRVLAPRINVKPNVVIQYLMGKGAFVNINQDLEEDVVRDIMSHFGYELELPRTVESMEKELIAESHEIDASGDGHEAKAAVESRAPVVTFMGHVDHGKTSLLDYIRKTMVTKGEKGGITQHIGAYKVETPNGSVTFLDTPGHAAFTAMRARGANATDVVVLVVAADDGVMPQTKEAIDHARAAGVPIVVAINKCDLPSANPDRVKTELQQENLVPEEWGGKTVMVEVSAHTGEGVDHLVEMLMLESEMLELKANPKLRARGVVIESKKTPDQGVVATLLIQNGTLRLGDIVLCGPYYGKVKAMISDVGERVGDAPPATPVEVLGLQGVPEAGEEFFVVKDEKKARTLSILKQSESRHRNMAGSQRVTLEDLHSRIVEGSMKELKIILKADVQGSVEALKTSLEELTTDEVRLNIILSAVGNINESDVMLAVVSNAVVIGFHVKVDPKAEYLAKNEKVDIHLYDVIYEAIADVKAGMEGLLEPEEREVFQGRAQVREVFPTSKGGKAAGCVVVKGTIHRKDRIRVRRGQEVIYDGEISSLKRFKDDVKEVKEGFECGISIKGFDDIRKNDAIEAFIIEKVARRLEK